MYSTGDELDGKFVILAGYLKKRERTLNSWTIGYFAILSGGILVELNGPRPTVSISLSEFEVSDATVAVGKFHAFCLTKSVKEKLYLRAASEEDANKWVSVLEKFKKDSTIPFIINEEPSPIPPTPPISLVSTFPEPTVKVNNFGVVLDANQAALTLFDCNLDTLLGQSLKSFLLLDDKTKADNFMDLFIGGNDKPEFTLAFDGGDKNKEVIMAVVDNGDCFYLKFSTQAKQSSILLEMDELDYVVLSDDETRKKSPGGIRFLPRLNILRNKKEVLSPRGGVNSPLSARSSESDQEPLSLSPRLRNEFLDAKNRRSSGDISFNSSVNNPKKRRPRTLSLKQSTVAIETTDDIAVASTIKYVSSSPAKTVETKSFTHSPTRHVKKQHQKDIEMGNLQFATCNNPVKEIEGVLAHLDKLKQTFEESEAVLRSSITSLDTSESNINFVKNTILATKVKELEDKLKKLEKPDAKRKRGDKKNVPVFSEVLIREQILSNIPLFSCIVDNWNCMVETIQFDRLIRIEIDLIKSCLLKWQKLPNNPCICHCLSYNFTQNLNSYSLKIYSTKYTETLKSYIEKKTKFPLEVNEISLFLRNIISGLKFLATNQIVHGNLKTENIFISRNFDNSIANLVFYNYGRALWPAPLLQSKPSPIFLPPECNLADGLPSPCTTIQTDIWFLGLIILELLTGTVPSKEAVVKPSLPPLPPSYNLLCSLYESCTKLKPGDRISLQELEEKLNK